MSIVTKLVSPLVRFGIVKDAQQAHTILFGVAIVIIAVVAYLFITTLHRPTDEEVQSSIERNQQAEDAQRKAHTEK